MQAYDHFGGVPGPWTPEEAPGKRVRVSQQESARSNACLAHHSLVIERGSPLRATIAVSSFQQCRISATLHGRSERGFQFIFSIHSSMQTSCEVYPNPPFPNGPAAARGASSRMVPALIDRTHFESVPGCHRTKKNLVAATGLCKF